MSSYGNWSSEVVGTTYDGFSRLLNTKQWKSLKFVKWCILFLIFLHYIPTCNRVMDVPKIASLWVTTTAFGILGWQWLATTARLGEEEFHKINIAYQLRHQKTNFWKCLPFENFGGESFRFRGFNRFWGVKTNSLPKLLKYHFSNPSTSPKNASNTFSVFQKRNPYLWTEPPTRQKPLE